MYIQLHPTYTLRVVVKDKPIERPVEVPFMGTVDTNFARERQFNDGLEGSKTGCDEVLKAVRDALASANLAHVSVTFEKFDYAG